MDLKILPSLVTLQSQGMARPEVIGEKNGFRLTPQNAKQAAQLLYWGQERGRPLAANPQDANRLSEPLWLSYEGLKQVRKHPVSDFIIEVEAGLTFGELNQLLLPHKQLFPLSYPNELPIGQALAEDRPALETGLRGYPRDYVLKTEIATPDAELSISGADVVKNVTGYDLAKLYVGGHQAFGFLTAVTLKLTSLPQQRTLWQYTPSSYHAAANLCQQLLDSPLPLSMCELYDQKGQWCVLIELSGDVWIQTECQTIFSFSQGEMACPTPLGNSEGDTEREAWLTPLQTWTPNATVVEIALPLGYWAAFGDMLTRQAFFQECRRMQVRPAAGLIYLEAAQFPFSALRYLKTEAQQLGGFVQLLQIAPSDATTASEAMAAFAEFNLPDDPTVRALLKQLKKSYDPKGALFTPRLPL